MWRTVHSLLGVVACLLVISMALSGAVLSTVPLLTDVNSVVRGVAGPEPGSLTVADTFAAVSRMARLAGGGDLEKLRRTASGAYLLTHTVKDQSVTDYIDPRTGTILERYQPSPVYAAIVEFHRSFLLEWNGRLAAGIAAAAMAILSLSGTIMLINRMGGIAAFFKRARGGGVQRLHSVLGRWVVVPFLLTAVTGTVLSLQSFELVSSGDAELRVEAQSQDGEPAVAAQDMPALRAIPLSSLRELTFPLADDPQDVFSITTATGHVLADRSSGKVLSATPFGLAETLTQWVTLLHTGDGASWLALLLGAAALVVPFMAVTGLVTWYRRVLVSGFRVPGNRPARLADVVLLVGTEGNTTVGFARTLHRELTRHGSKVHLGRMSAFTGDYPKACHVVVLAATYGDGQAPSSAAGFLERLDKLAVVPVWAAAVVGFGDRSFPHFCQFATDVEAALKAKGVNVALPVCLIDRQSTQSFAAWGRDFGKVLSLELEVNHVPQRLRTRQMVLKRRTDYGADVDAATTILQFAVPTSARDRAGALPDCLPGDLIGIYPPGSDVARFYSIVPGIRPGLIEICVRRQPGGLCSGFLHGLKAGDSIDMFLRPNPEFRVAGRKPTIMIAAGTGIAPFVGMARHNNRRRTLHLYWGGRDPASDFLYQSSLSKFVADGRLNRFVPAFSRVDDSAYVQDRISADADPIRKLLKSGARVMVCGGQQMAAAVRAEIDRILVPLNTSVQELKAAGRYLEDIY